MRGGAGSGGVKHSSGGGGVTDSLRRRYVFFSVNYFVQGGIGIYRLDDLAASAETALWVHHRFCSLGTAPPKTASDHRFPSGVHGVSGAGGANSLPVSQPAY